MGDEQAETLEQRVEREASEARARWIGDAVGGAQWAALDEPERVDWRDVVRPLVERIVELEGAPANVDAPQGETLIKRVGREVGPALDRWQACNDGNHSSMRAAIGPLVAANMGLEDERDSARESAKVRADKLTAAQTAGRDQESEIEKLRARIAELLATQDTCRRVAWHCADEVKGITADATRMAKESLSDLTRERETVRKLLADNAALETTVDVLAGRLAARGQS